MLQEILERMLHFIKHRKWLFNLNNHSSWRKYLKDILGQWEKGVIVEAEWVMIAFIMGNVLY